MNKKWYENENIKYIGHAIFVFTIVFGFIIGCNIDRISRWFDSSKLHDTIHVVEHDTIYDTIYKFRDENKEREIYEMMCKYSSSRKLEDIIQEYVEDHIEDYVDEDKAREILEQYE